MATVYQEYLGRFPIGSSTDSLGVGTTALTLTAGSYYLRGYTGESTAQLLEHLQAKIRTVSGQSSANVSYCADNAAAVNTYVKIELTAASNIGFTDSALATILGFPTTSASAQTHTGTRKPRYVWRPTDPLADVDTTPEEMFGPTAACKVYRSADGSVCSVDGVTVLRDARRVTYQALPQADVIKNVATTETYRSLEQFYEDVIARGRPMRVYPDRLYNNSASYVTAVYAAETPPAFAELAGKVVTSYLGYWRVDLPLWKVS